MTTLCIKRSTKEALSEGDTGGSVLSFPTKDGRGSLLAIHADKRYRSQCERLHKEGI